MCIEEAAGKVDVGGHGTTVVKVHHLKPDLFHCYMSDVNKSSKVDPWDNFNS